MVTSGVTPHAIFRVVRRGGWSRAGDNPGRFYAGRPLGERYRRVRDDKRESSPLVQVVKVMASRIARGCPRVRLLIRPRPDRLIIRRPPLSAIFKGWEAPRNRGQA